MQSLPPEDYIRSALYRCNDCNRGHEVFLYHENDDRYRYFDPNTETAETGVQRYEQQNTPECPHCGSEDVYAYKY